jgi:hypothetical protein
MDALLAENIGTHRHVCAAGSKQLSRFMPTILNSLFINGIDLKS